MRSNNGTLIYVFFVNLHVQHIIPFYHNHIHVCFLIRMLHLEKWSFFDMKTTSLTLRKRKPRKIPTQKIWIDFMLMKSEKFFMLFQKYCFHLEYHLIINHHHFMVKRNSNIKTQGYRSTFLAFSNNHYINIIMFLYMHQFRK